MDHTLDVSTKSQDTETAAKLRIESFKMGGGAPAHALSKLTKHSHGRSHSRNNSISALSLSASAPALPSLDFSSNTNVLPNGPLSKRNSHHRRRSSVSTRRESAELMGVSLPDLPVVHSDDNINLGDRDSIRRRALLALEGKPDLAFSKVEIPDITSPDTTKTFEFPTKPSFPPGSGMNNHAISGLMGKRDSFGKMFGPTSVSKDQLQTLVEEEEEEEEERSNDQAPQEPVEVSPPVKPVDTKTFRARPASLNLRTLSLVNGSVVGSTGGLPTPSSTPSPRIGGLRSLTLTGASGPYSSPNTMSHFDTFNQLPSVPRSLIGDKKHSISDTSSASDVSLKKRSSISYKRSVDFIPREIVSLPTPEMTPTTDRRFSTSSDQSTLVEQPLTAAEQHFLFRSHNVLLSRITELERTLRKRSSLYSRPVSYSSEVSVGSSEPSDEMLQLISDLKAERDELKRDVEGWRMRVADADKQASVLTKRIEVERRDAWVARSRLGLLEVEKTRLEKALEDKAAALDQALAQKVNLTHERDTLKEGVNRLNARLQDADAAIDECIHLRATLEQERACRRELERLMDDAGLLNTPTIFHPVNGTVRKPDLSSQPYGSPRGLGFRSVDSESSTTEVESLDDSFTKAELTLDVVTEEDLSDEEEDALAGYEDADDSDLSFQSPGASSVGSNDELDLKANAGLTIDDASKRPDSFSMPTKPTHRSHASLSKTWTFPRGSSIAPVKKDDDIDRFFGCLDDIDVSPPLESEERTKGLFASAFCRSADDEDELPPFVLPSDVGTVIDIPVMRSLQVVLEEDEEVSDESDDEFIGEEVDGGIRFTFNPPPTIGIPPPQICVTPPTAAVSPCASIESSPSRALPGKPVSLFRPYDDEDTSVPFQFPQVQTETKPRAPNTPATVSSPAHSDSSRPFSRASTSPSSIPRATSLRSFSPPAQVTPSKSSGGLKGIPFPRCSFVTPPSKKGGSAPTFIPQPKPSPAAVAQSTPTKPRISSVQKTKGPSSHPNGSVKPQPKSSMSTPNPFPLSCFTANDFVRCPSFSESDGATPEMNVDESSLCSGDCHPQYRHYPQTPSTSLSSIMSSPLSARLSLQKISSFIPFSWTPGAATAASHIVSSLPNSSSPGSTESASLLFGAGGRVPRATERRFVSRDKQLEQLRSRLSLEKSTGAGSCSMVSVCKGCRAGEVYL